MNNVFKAAFAAIIAIVFTVSCSKGIEVIYEQDTPVRSVVTPSLTLNIESDSETKQLSYGIHTTPIQFQVETNSGSLTKSNAEILSEGYVFQFNSCGLMLAKDSFSLVPGEELRPQLVTGLGQIVYVIANCTGLNISTIKDLASFENFAYPVDIIKTDDDIPYVGFASGVNIEADENGQGIISFSNGDPVKIGLKKIVSKIDLEYSFDVTNAVLTSISIVDAPSTISFVSPSADGVLTFYPEAIVEANFKTETIIIEKAAANAGRLSWYISDNIRGSVAESTSEKDKNAINAPSKSTYICFEAQDTENGNTYKYSLYPGNDVIGDYNLRRGNIYLMNVSISSGEVGKDNRITVIEPPVIIEHKYAEPANCYIVKPGEEVVIGYRMGADGKENSYTSEVEIKDAVIVWQTKEEGCLALGNQGDVLSFSRDEELEDDLLTVKTAAEGNALVAVRDRSDNILWSWHIWVTSYNPEENNLDYNNTIWMDRSLGALNNARGEKRTEGWLYQWGRKDPFPPIDWLELLEEGSIHHTIILYDGEGNALPDVDTIEGDKQVAKMPVGAAESNLDYSITHPLTFITNNTASESNTVTSSIHWITSIQESDAMTMTLWSAVSKTAFDPCPAGWTIASTNFYSNDPPKHNSLTYTAGAISSFSSDNPQERGAYLNVLDNQTVWVPFQGYRRCTKGGSNVNCGDVGVFWTNKNQDAYRTWAIKFSAADMRTMVTYPRSNGLCVRCIKQNDK